MRAWRRCGRTCAIRTARAPRRRRSVRQPVVKAGETDARKLIRCADANSPPSSSNAPSSYAKTRHFRRAGARREPRADPASRRTTKARGRAWRAATSEAGRLDDATAALDAVLQLNHQNSIARSLQVEVTKRRAATRRAGQGVAARAREGEGAEAASAKTPAPDRVLRPAGVRRRSRSSRPTRRLEVLGPAARSAGDGGQRAAVRREGRRGAQPRRPFGRAAVSPRRLRDRRAQSDRRGALRRQARAADHRRGDVGGQPGRRRPRFDPAPGSRSISRRWKRMRIARTARPARWPTLPASSSCWPRNGRHS